MSNTFGSLAKLTVFGASHGPVIGGVLEGVPDGIYLDPAFIATEMGRRAPGQSAYATSRKEEDKVEFLSGIFEGRTTGAPLAFTIANKNTQSKDYAKMRSVMRPSHADYVAYKKYHGHNDYRGGGTFSGRLTAVLVAAGAVAKLVLSALRPPAKSIKIAGHIASIANIYDRAFNPLGETEETLATLAQRPFPVLDLERGGQMQEAINEAKKEQDSVGGQIECLALNVPLGLGEPFFDSVESSLSHLLFSIPAVKAVEFGSGMELTTMRGSAANDPLRLYDGEQVRTVTNHNGGITGGITNAMPLIVRVGIKPTPSIGLRQQTIDVATMTNVDLEIKGRHDPCIVPRAVPVVEAAVALVLLDFILRRGAYDA